MREENNYRCLIDYMKNTSYEVHQRWDDTDAYREYEQKTKNYTKEKWADANDGIMAIFAEFAVCKASGASADSAEAQALVAKLQAHITADGTQGDLCRHGGEYDRCAQAHHRLFR